MHLFTRQKALIGQKSQDQLAQSKVVIVGCGALGSCVAHLLTRMGVGHLTLIDQDIIADHNLGRQHLYTTEDIGLSKATTLKTKLQLINPQITITVHNVFLDEKNTELLEESDLIIDCVDTHHFRRLINDYAKQHNKPWIHGAAIEQKGEACLFLPDSSFDYHSLYNNQATDQHCEITGVTATITTLIGTLQSQLAFSYLTKQETTTKLLRINLETMEFLSIDHK
jgi:adenylyltransferase/sulfurtransferase